MTRAKGVNNILTQDKYIDHDLGLPNEVVMSLTEGKTRYLHFSLYIYIMFYDIFKIQLIGCLQIYLPNDEQLMKSL